MEPDRPDRRLDAVESGAVPVDARTRRDRPAPSRAASVSLEAGDEADFCSFYRSSRDTVARALALTIGDPDLAAEAVDEAMARAFQRWARVEALDNPAGWVYRVAFNWAVSALRRSRREPARTLRAEVPASPPIAEPSVARALAELEVRQRAVVVCRYLLGWTEAETATALGTPVGTVKSRLHRASRILAARLSHLRSEEDL